MNKLNTYMSNQHVTNTNNNRNRRGLQRPRVEEPPEVKASCSEKPITHAEDDFNLPNALDRSMDGTDLFNRQPACYLQDTRALGLIFSDRLRFLFGHGVWGASNVPAHSRESALEASVGISKLSFIIPHPASYWQVASRNTSGCSFDSDELKPLGLDPLSADIEPGIESMETPEGEEVCNCGPSCDDSKLFLECLRMEVEWIHGFRR
jgi:hypothetical protein